MSITRTSPVIAVNGPGEGAAEDDADGGGRGGGRL